MSDGKGSRPIKNHVPKNHNSERWTVVVIVVILTASHSHRNTSYSSTDSSSSSSSSGNDSHRVRTIILYSKYTILVYLGLQQV